MRSINQLIQHMNKEGNDPNIKREYDAFKQLDDNIIELQNRIKALEKKNMKYYCRAYRNIIIAVPNLTPTIVPFILTEYPQFGNMHDNVIQNDKIYIRRSGIYHCSSMIRFASGLGGTFRSAEILRTSAGVVSTITSEVFPPSASAISLSFATSIYLYTNDFLQVRANQDSGGPLNLVVDAPPFLAVSERIEDLDPSEFGLLDPAANMR